MSRNIAIGALAAGLLVPLLTTPASAAPDTLISTNFNDGTLGGWEQSGSPELSYVPDEAGGSALRVGDRTNDFSGIQTPAGFFDDLAVGDTLTFSMKSRLVDPAPAPVGVRFVMKTSYAWIGNTTMTADAWTTVTGTYEVAEGTDLSTLQAYIGTADIPETASYSYLVDDLTISVTPADGPATPQPSDLSSLNTGFEDGLGAWIPRADGSGEASVTVSTTEAHSGSQAALISNRTSQGQGIGHDVTGILLPGQSYQVTAWVKFAAGQTPGDVWLSLARTTGGSTSYGTLGQFTGMSNSAWVEVSQTFQMGAADSALLYFETAYNGGNTSSFLIDDISVTIPSGGQVEDLTPIQDTVDFPVGVAIDSRETTGTAAELLTRHFKQVTSENYMKPEAWYDANGTFTPNPEADTLMRFAQDNDLNVYGHTLVWHSQTPAWFFQNDAGAALTTSERDRSILRNRMRTHIFAVAEHLSDTYGPFGSASNPLSAFDVVNEVVSDGNDNADGLRRSEWFRILGEEFIDLAFTYADEAFNGEYAAAGSDRPITLFINDYNTEQSGKQARLLALVQRMLERGTPVDGVGHQFHVSLSTPVTALEAALSAFEGLGLTQAVTELDVTTGTPVTQAKLVEQGYYYRDAFRIFQDHTDDLFSVTIWGLTDGRSWRNSSGAPLVFTDAFAAKPAYYGIVDAELPARLRTANVFQGDVPLDAAATDALEWRKLPLQPIEQQAEFQLRWQPDHLTAFVTVNDSSVDASDAVQFTWAGQTATVGRTGGGDVESVVTETADGYRVVAHLPLAGAAQGDTVEFDARVTNGATTAGWNSPGVVGTLTLLEPLSYVEIPETAATPAIDGVIDEAWTTAASVETGKQVEGADSAPGTFRTLWRDNTLYLMAEVTDPTVDVSGSDPWIQDSVEIYVDAGNVKNGSYRYDDTQIRISADNVVSFGTGDEPFQRARVESATSRTETGYLVEVAVGLLESGGADTFQGLDVQVNDAAGGARTGIRNWADPSGAGYQSTARWGVARLVPADQGASPVVSLSSTSVVAGQSIDVHLSGFDAGVEVELVLREPAAPASAALRLFALAAAAPAVLVTVTTDAAGAATARLTVPASTPAGAYEIAALQGGVTLATAPVAVLAAADPQQPGNGNPGAVGNGTGVDRAGTGGLSDTGANPAGWVWLGLVLLISGATLVRVRRAARVS
ncbi:endo-1,4-beta-xylanase [Mycetocola zhadangensis]|uniref:endo-1,4-beta-xylanase n=1 Tax=Mycetocola zhadangensis TaxID=1164595 RepID=UPI003A4D5F2C